MTRAYRPLLLLALPAPALLLVPFADRLIYPLAYWTYLLVISAVGIAAVLTSTGSSLRRIWSTGRPALICGAAVAAILALQSMPWAPAALAYPIWHNAAQALDLDLGNTISLDPGATAGSLVSLAFGLMVALVFCLVSDTRAQAAGLYRALCLGLSVVIAVWTALRLTSGSDGARDGAPSTASCVALVMAASLIMEALRHRSSDIPRSRRMLDLGLGAFGVAASAAGLLSIPDPAGIVLALAGIGITAVASRLPNVKFGARVSFVAALLATLAITVLVLRPDRAADDLSVPHATSGPTLSATSTARMLSDAPPLGTGGGTFPLLVELYRQGSQEGSSAPSLAALLYVEFGPFGTPVLLFCWLYLALELLAGALRRGRDRYVCASAAGICLVLTIKAALDTGVADAAIRIVLSGLIGIALAQRISPDA